MTDQYDFYRCLNCHGIITWDEKVATVSATGSFCRCGCQRISPTWPRWWEWLLPRVAAYAWRTRGGPTCA